MSFRRAAESHTPAACAPRSRRGTRASSMSRHWGMSGGASFMNGKPDRAEAASKEIQIQDTQVQSYAWMIFIRIFSPITAGTELIELDPVARKTTIRRRTSGGRPDAAAAWEARATNLCQSCDNSETKGQKRTEFRMLVGRGGRGSFLIFANPPSISNISPPRSVGAATAIVNSVTAHGSECCLPPRFGIECTCAVAGLADVPVFK